MKKITLTILFYLCVYTSFAQRNDNVWLLGYKYYTTFTPALDFYFNVADTIGWNIGFYGFFGADASICNDAGDLMFYTNGVKMYSYNNDTLAGSVGFNVDSTTINNNLSSERPQSVIILPYPGHQQQYAVFHAPTHTWASSSHHQPLRLSMSVVDMNLNNGFGAMTVKDSVVINDTLLHATLVTTKHGNGRDWWILMHAATSSDFYVCLLTPDGITQVTQQTVSPSFGEGIYGQSLFSPDGSILALCDGTNGRAVLYNFDRCSGILTLKETFPVTPQSSTNVSMGISFSPDSKLLYISSVTQLFQYEADSTPVASTERLIADWDGFSGGVNSYKFRYHRLGPDGKIYITPLPNLMLHVINNPDMRDTACDFQQHSLLLKSYHSGYLPEFTNYRLGALAGSPCDSLTVGLAEYYKEEGLKIAPNPAHDQISIEYILPGFENGTLHISDISGKRVFMQSLPHYSYVQNISLADFKPGIYFVTVTSKNSSTTKKLVVLE